MIHSSELDGLVDEIWKVYDRDGNGYLDTKEATAMFRDIYESRGEKLNAKELKRIMALVDANGDGRMDKSELKKILQ